MTKKLLRERHKKYCGLGTINKTEYLLCKVRLADHTVSRFTDFARTKRANE